MSAGYQLEVGALALMNNRQDPAYTINTHGVDAEFGNPVPVAEVMQSLMRDGDLTATTRDGNRVASFTHEIKAKSIDGLLAGEERLLRELDRVNTLSWYRPEGVPTTVFEVLRSSSDFMFEDLAEVGRKTWKYRVTYECLPYSRSVDEVSFTWDGPGTDLEALGSLTGWTVVSGSPTVSTGAGGVPVGLQVSASGTPASAVLRRSFELDDFLWFKVQASTAIAARLLTDVKVDGVAVPDAKIRQEGTGLTRFYTVDTRGYRGETVSVEFKLTTGISASANVYLSELWTVSYPNAVISGSTQSNPKGIGVIDVYGTARAPATIKFTAPSGGAFVYTAPDPLAIRDRGLGELVFGAFEAGAGGEEIEISGRAMWFPEGYHATTIGFSDPQPLELNPNGVWPQEGTGVTTDGVSQYVYPADRGVAVSFYNDSGAKALVSPSPNLPSGYHGGAVFHENHVLHPGRCGFAVLDINGDPISATVTYYPRWKHNAAR